MPYTHYIPNKGEQLMTDQHHPLTDEIIAAALQDLEDQEDLRLVMERKDSISIPITLEELSMLPTQ